MNRPEQNPNQVPVSFVNCLNQNDKAKHYFSSLKDQDKLRVLNFIQISSTGEEEERRSQQAVSGLEQRNIAFL